MVFEFIYSVLMITMLCRPEASLKPISHVLVMTAWSSQNNSTNQCQECKSWFGSTNANIYQLKLELHFWNVFEKPPMWNELCMLCNVVTLCSLFQRLVEVRLLGEDLTEGNHSMTMRISNHETLTSLRNWRVEWKRAVILE